MDIVHYRCAGLDVSKRDAKVCVRVQAPDRARATSTVTTWGSVTNQILALRDHLITEHVTLVVMEAIQFVVCVIGWTLVLLIVLPITISTSPS